ncbi:sulfatase-like hydrolase/transferase [Rhodobacterales bacterium]|nr:sulfatase-like hydrolase/transferase [Rhodobacterales bacterium]
MTGRPNILLITADQWRGDCLGAAGHPVVLTPNLDAFAATGTLFEQHYAPTAPCSPARASLYTGLYQMNHRVVRNGAPLDNRFDNIARAARRAGYNPTLFGYTDTAPDPRYHDPADPALSTYEGTLPGFTVRQSLPEDDGPWLSWLAARGYDRKALQDIHQVPADKGERISRQSPRYGPEETQTAFLTDAFLRWLGEQDGDRPWMAHVSYLRPHPPIVVPEPYNEMYDATDGPDFSGADTPQEEAALHPLVAALQDAQHLSHHIPGADGLVRDLTRHELRRLRALYYGMISEVDAQLGRIFKTLDRSDDTLIIFTSDHAEMMGDHWMLGKGGFHRQSYHIPLIIRLPGAARANRVTALTSAADVFPTLLDLLHLEPTHAPDGDSLLPYLRGQTPVAWRDAAIWEFDYRQLFARHRALFPPMISGRNSPALISRLSRDWHYVHFADLPDLLMPTAHKTTAPTNVAQDRPDIVMANLQALLSQRMRHNDETLARSMVWDYHG